MNTKYISSGTKIGFIVIVVVLLSSVGLFTCLFFNCIANYSAFNVAYSDLTYRELTFERYEKRSYGNSAYAYDVYFKEYAEPCQIDSITRQKADDAALAQLAEKQTVQVYLRQDSKDDYTICQMCYNDTMIFSLQDYVKANQTNQVIGMFCSPLLVLCGVFLLWGCFRFLKPGCVRVMIFKR